MRGRGYEGYGTGVRSKDLRFYIYSMASEKVNPNNGDIPVYKSCLFPTLAQTPRSKLQRAVKSQIC